MVISSCTFVASATAKTQLKPAQREEEAVLSTVPQKMYENVIDSNEVADFEGIRFSLTG